MIHLEGRMLTGLDEFMLRLGHLKVLCEVASDVGGSWFRINREASKVLTNAVSISSQDEKRVAEYLRRKRLCAFVRGVKEKENQNDQRKFRYPHLVVELQDDGLHIESDADEPKIWWQDLCLASAGIASRVGAITSSAKSGSKTGLSHINDWAQFLGLISRAGDVAPIGRLIISLGSDGSGNGNWSNPYIIGFERIALAYTIIHADIDCFSRLAPKLLKAKCPLRKAGATYLFADAVQGISQEARDARYLSVGRKNKLYENMRDLENAARRGKRDLGSTSTAWHRASSRLETYVDLGLLEKGRGGEQERFEYVYYPTAALKHTVGTLETAKDARDWLENHLSSVLFNKDCFDSYLDEDELLMFLPRVVSSLARPTGPLPIDAVSVGLVWLCAENDDPISISAARKSLERLAHIRPEIARLSRGGSGDRAEFISLDVRKLEGLTA